METLVYKNVTFMDLEEFSDMQKNEQPCGIALPVGRFFMDIKSKHKIRLLEHEVYISHIDNVFLLKNLSITCI